MSEASRLPSRSMPFKGTPRYELRAVRGVGAMGVVYEAFDWELGIPIAVKCLTSSTPHAVARFKREFRSLRDLHHENLVKLGELVAVAGQLFFTMELIPGIDIVSHCGGMDAPASGVAHRPLPPCTDDTTLDSPPTGEGAVPALADRRHHSADLARIGSTFAQLARGLMALHAAGKVHRDVKPSNVLVTHDEKVVLLDFGVVGDFEPGSPHVVELVGTAAYMSPEQAARMDAGPASDWYSFGAMLFEALTGRLPLEGETRELLEQKQNAHPPSLREAWPGAPLALDELCARLLESEPERRPSGAQILGVLESGKSTSLEHLLRPPRPTFVGRESELQTFSQALARVRAGKLAVVHVEGQSGTGKSTLVDHFLERARRAPEVLVLKGRCSEREYVPYRAVDGVVDDLVDFLSTSGLPEVGPLLARHLTGLSRAFPIFGKIRKLAPSASGGAVVADPHLGRQALFRALRELLSFIAARKVVVIALDDMQWADADSLSLLSALLREPEVLPVLLLVASRPHWSGRSLLRTWGAEPVALGNLAHREAVALAEELLLKAGCAASPSVVEQIALEGAGHPLFVQELAQQSAHEGGGAPLPILLDSVLWARVERLKPRSQRLVKLAAIAGSSLPYRMLLNAVGQAACEDSSTLAEQLALRNQHLLRFDGTGAWSRVEPYHDRVASAVRAHLPSAEQRELHRAIALALQDHAADHPEELAVHWQGAGVPVRAASYALLAADAAAHALAFERAARLYRVSLECSPHQPGADQVRHKLGDALANAGLGAAAASAYLEAARGVEEPQRLDLERLAADQLFRAGHIDDAEPLIRRVLMHAGLRVPHRTFWILALLCVNRIQLVFARLKVLRAAPRSDDPRELAQLNACWSVAVGLSMVSNVLGACLQSRHLVLAIRVGQPVPLVKALATEASYVSCRGLRSRRRAQRLLDHAEGLAGPLVDPYVRGFLTLSKAICSFLVGEWATAKALTRVAEKVFETRPAGAMWELTSARTFGAWSSFYLGDLAAMRAGAADYIQEAETRGDRYAATLHRTGLVVMIWLASDEPHLARRHVLEAETGWSRSTFDFQRYLITLGHCLVDLYEGAPELAYRRVTEIWPLLRSSSYLRIQNVRIEATYVRGIAALGAAKGAASAERFLRDAARCAKAIARERVGWAVTLSECLQGGVLDLQGRDEAALCRWQAAESAARAHGMQLFATAARYRAELTRAGAAGHTNARDACATLVEQNVREPERICAMLAPGTSRRRTTSSRHS